jgi:alanyl-tRNA synthetase
MKASQKIRKEFLDFFKSKDHKIVKSSPVIPQDDPTLLFTNAGMNQFKKIFLGLEKPEYLRIADVQKCIRVSGKHNDLEEVGKDTCHHTFFEMLGNWSFGDYYKNKAIKYAWEILTEVWNLPKERLWATVYKGDDETARLWIEVTDISPNRVLKFGEKDNFWEMGDTGPCGPCSEIHYYTGDALNSQSASKINSGDPEYIELWNLVFIQYNRDETGNLHPLSKKHVDTGAGFERIVAILQGKHSNYDTDLFQPIIDTIADLTGTNYTEKNGMAHRVIADHVRMLTFAIAEGGMPSNEGRGYVIRRILRRAARFGRILNMHEPFIYKLVDNVIDIMGSTYQEVLDRREHIQKVIESEERLFGETLDKGLEVFEKIKVEVLEKNSVLIPGKDAFKLYDTYGFPLDLTKLIADEDGLRVDEEGFNREMEKQRKRARENVALKTNYSKNLDKWIILTEGKNSEFVGYELEETDAVIRRYIIDKGKIHIILDRTPFYAESGGEVGDSGKITSDEFKVKIEDTIKSNGETIHIGYIESGKIGNNPNVHAVVDKARSKKIKANHTATHLLQAALRQVLGPHIHQAGSLVLPDRLRFDLTHYEKIKQEDLYKVEDIVNQKIRENIKVEILYRKYDEAKKSGAMALFGEKYGDIVRVIKIGDYSMELCGGKHASRTGDIGYFKIISESSVAAGIRRIEAVTGEEAILESRVSEVIIKELERIFGVTKEKLTEKIDNFIREVKELQRKVSRKESQNLELEIKQLLENSKTISDIKMFTHQFESKNIDELKKICDIIRNSLKDSVGVIASVNDNKPTIAVTVSDSVIKKYGIKANDLVKELGKVLGGGGGGHQHLATAGGKYPEKIPEVFNVASKLIRKKVKQW